MSILGRAIKDTVGLLASGLDFVITKGTDGIGKKYGDNQIVKTASEIGVNTVRVTESTFKTLTDVVDGGIDAGVGYLAKDETKIDDGLERSKAAGKDLAVGVGKGLVITYEAGAKTAGSAITAGKHYYKGDKNLADQEFTKTKVYARDLGKLVAVGILAFGPPEYGKKDKIDK